MELIIKNISAHPSEASDVLKILDKEGVEWNTIGCHNWSENYPYKPQAKFRIAYSENNILIQYDVDENSIRATEISDNGHVWEDSCCEFFIAPMNDGMYYNIECNCIGTLLIGVGKGRENRQLASQDILDQVKRWSSLDHKEIPLQKGRFHWQLALMIPISTFFKHQMGNILNLSMKCNIYKCGDKLCEPHFLSWSPITSTTPDFHRLDDFANCLIRQGNETKTMAK